MPSAPRAFLPARFGAYVRLHAVSIILPCAHTRTARAATSRVAYVASARSWPIITSGNTVSSGTAGGHARRARQAQRQYGTTSARNKHSILNTSISRRRRRKVTASMGVALGHVINAMARLSTPPRRSLFFHAPAALTQVLNDIFRHFSMQDKGAQDARL